MFSILTRVLKRNEAVSDSAAARRRIDLGDGDPPGAIYAIGDVHGCLDLLVTAEQKILRDVEAGNSTGLVVLLGDYVDRGPDSAGVLEHLSSPPPRGLRRVMLCGNHEAAFLDFIENPEDNMHWLDFGGRQTLLSYGIDADHLLGRGRRGPEELKAAVQAAVPERHRNLLASMPIYIRIGSFVFVHAGLRPGLPLQDQSDLDMMWIREPFLTEGPKLPFVVVHGHTPSTKVQVGQGRICIDTGAVSTGRLSVLKILNGRVRLLGD